MGFLPGWPFLSNRSFCSWLLQLSGSSELYYVILLLLYHFPYMTLGLDIHLILGLSYVPYRHIYNKSNKPRYTYVLYFRLYGSIALLSHNTLKGSAILGLSFFAWCWWLRESMLQGSSTLCKFRTSLSKVLILWHCVKVKQRYLSMQVS